jgi:hypothetical protein
VQATVTVSVPGGRWVDGVRYRDVEIRPLPTRDEFLLADAQEEVAGHSTASRLTWLLSRCVVRLAPGTAGNADSVRDLTVGDREALALHVRRLLFGERMAGVVSCPDCRERLDLELSVDQLLVPAYPDALPSYQTTIQEGGAEYRVRFRLPTGRDQEQAGSLADGATESADVILERCIVEVSRVDGDVGQSGAPDLTALIAPHVSALMAELDPQAVLNLDMRCPSCSHDFVVPFSPSAFLVREVVERSKRLISEVHALAMTYHWSESAILALPTRRRHAYLDLLDRSQLVESLS